MIKKIALNFFLLAAFFGLYYEALAIFAPQNLKVWNDLDHQTFFPALRAGKMFLSQIPHWCWVTLGVLSVPSALLVWALCIIAKIDRIVGQKATSTKSFVAPRLARSPDSWKKNWEKPPELPRSVKLVKFDDMIFPDRPSLPELTLRIRCQEKSFVKGCGFTLITKCKGEMKAHHHDFRQ
jgi:hypothetical protein